VLSTQGDSSSNGTVFDERKNTTISKLKSNSISSGSNERTKPTTVKKELIDSKNQQIQSTVNKKLVVNNHPEFCQRIKMNDNSRNVYHHQNNHHRYNKIYSSGEREGEEVPSNYLAKTSEKLKFQKNKKNKFDKIFKNSNISRGRSNKSGPTSNRHSSGEPNTPGVIAPSGSTLKLKLKNNQQTIKFSKKKIHIKRTPNQNPKRSRSLSNNIKVSSSKKSDESGNIKEDTEDNSSNGKKAHKGEAPTNWNNNGTNISKITALASISKFNNTNNFNSEGFQTIQIMKKSASSGHSQTKSPDIQEHDRESFRKQQTISSNPKLTTNVLSMTMKANENILSKNSGTIDPNSYNSLLSHQSKSFSNTKNEKSIGSIMNNKAFIPKKR